MCSTTFVGIQQNMRALTTSLMFNEEAVELWHRRMGHLNEADPKRLVNMSKGITLTQKPRVRAICEACSKAKSSRKVSKRVQHEILEKLGNWCYTYHRKEKTFQLFRQWKTEVETQSGCKVKIVRFDNGGEFKDSGIICEPTVAYTSERNGLSEVQNRIVMNGVRAMLFDFKLTRYLWSELLHTKVYQKNRSPTSRLKGITSHEAWTGEKPYLGHMRIFDCVVWVHISKENRKKLDERSKKCYLIDYEGTNVFRVWNPATRRVERVTHVDFDESRMMTSAVSDIGYWIAEATGDDVPDVFAAGEETEHPHTNDTERPSSIPNIDHIRNILTKEPSTGNTEDVGVTEDVIMSDEDIQDIPGPEIHPDPNTDGTYTSQPKRNIKPLQKAALNEKWSDTKMWAQRAIAHTKCDKTLEAERLYCMLATLSHGDPNHHDFEPDFDLAAAVQKIAEMRSYQATKEVDDYEPLIYKQAMSDPYAVNLDAGNRPASKIQPMYTVIRFCSYVSSHSDPSALRTQCPYWMRLYKHVSIYQQEKRTPRR